jgi:glycosyltransferase involved in cell wall biosynthesis
MGVPFHGISGNAPWCNNLMALRYLIKMVSPEVIHSYSFYTNFAVWLCSRGCKTVPIGSIRDSFISERRNSGQVLGRLSARLPATQIANSSVAKRLAEESRPPFRPLNVYLVKNGVDLDSFIPHPSLPKEPVLVAIGRLYGMKRWDRLIRAIAMVAAKGLTIKAKLAGDGPLLKDLEQQAEDLRVRHLIEFLGLRSDICELLGSCSFLVHTADEEGSPNVIMEAMACGRAVIATDVGDIPSLISDGITGFIVHRNDEQSLAKHMITLSKDPLTCAQMGYNGRRRAVREFGLDRLASETLNAYRAAGWQDAATTRTYIVNHSSSTELHAK